MKLSQLKPELNNFINYKIITTSSYDILKEDNLSLLVLTNNGPLTLNFTSDLPYIFNCVLYTVYSDITLTINIGNYIISPLELQYSNKKIYFFQIIVDTIYVSFNMDNITVNTLIDNYLNVNGINTTDDLPEGLTNLYYNETRFSNYLNQNVTSDNIPEGLTHLYYTEERANSTIDTYLGNVAPNNILGSIESNYAQFNSFISEASQKINDIQNYIQNSFVLPILNLSNPYLVIKSPVLPGIFTIKDINDVVLFTINFSAYLFGGFTDIYRCDLTTELTNNSITSGNIYKLYNDLIFNYYFIVL